MNKEIKPSFEATAQINKEDRTQDRVLIQVNGGEEFSVPAVILTEAEVVSISKLIEENKREYLLKEQQTSSLAQRNPKRSFAKASLQTILPFLKFKI